MVRGRQVLGTTCFVQQFSVYVISCKFIALIPNHVNFLLTSCHPSPFFPNLSPQRDCYAACMSKRDKVQQAQVRPHQPQPPPPTNPRFLYKLSFVFNLQLRICLALHYVCTKNSTWDAQSHIGILRLRFQNNLKKNIMNECLT